MPSLLVIERKPNRGSQISGQFYYLSVTRTGENRIVELKVAGRYRELPLWATRLSFEVRPGLNFDNRAWKLWKPVLLLLDAIVKKEKLKINWVRIHSHFNAKRDIPHAMGWWDSESKAMFLCHFDKETMLHEVGHVKSSGYHGDPWAKATINLYLKYLKGRELDRAINHFVYYLSARRVYKKMYGQKPPISNIPPNIWLHRKP